MTWDTQTDHCASQLSLDHSRIPAGKAYSACLTSLTSLSICVFCGCVCVYVCVRVHSYLFTWLSAYLAVCLYVWLTMQFLFYRYVYQFVCMCVSMGEMTTGFPAVLTTCSAPFSFPSVLLFTPLGCSTLTTHVVLSCLAFHFVVNGHGFGPYSILEVLDLMGIPFR